MVLSLYQIVFFFISTTFSKNVTITIRESFGLKIQYEVKIKNMKLFHKYTYYQYKKGRRLLSIGRNLNNYHLLFFLKTQMYSALKQLKLSVSI